MKSFSTGDIGLIVGNPIWRDIREIFLYLFFFLGGERYRLRDDREAKLDWKTLGQLDEGQRQSRHADWY